MKTIVTNANNISLYLFNDSENIIVEIDKIIIGDPERLIIGDLNSSNSKVFKNVENPNDWYGHKYFYSNNRWTLNPDFIDPRI